MIDAVRTLAQIDAAWIQYLLNEKGIETQISKATATPIGTGQVGATYRLILEQSGDGPDSLVAKLPSANVLSREAGKAHMTYIREARFYQQFAGRKPLPVPVHLYIAFDDQSHDFTLIMQDLAGYAPGNQLAFPSDMEVNHAIDAAAMIHAAWWDDPALDNMNWLNGTRAVPPQHDGDALYAMFWPAFNARFGALVTADMRRVGDVFVGKINDWYNGRSGPRCLVHNDYRPDNMLYDLGNPDRPLVVVDWQTAGVGCGATDVAYYLGTALDPVQRRQTEAGLISHYCKRLSEYGGTAFDKENVWDDYRRSAFAGFMMGVTASMVVEQTERGDAMFLAMCERSAKMVLDHFDMAVPGNQDS